MLKLSKFFLPTILFFLLAITALAAEDYALSDQIKITSSEGSVSVDGTTVSFSVESSKTSAKTSTIYLYNNTTSAATISFDYSASTSNTTFNLEGSTVTKGSYSTLVSAGGYISLSLKATNGFLSTKTATLELTNLSFVEAAASSNVTFQYNSTYGAVAVDGVGAASGSISQITPDGAVLSVTVQSGYSFLGWVDASNNMLLSTDTSYTLKPVADMTVQAIFIKTTGDDAWFLVGGEYLYDDLNAADAKAATLSNKTIVLMNNGTLPAGDYSIRSGVTFLIPFDDSNTFRGTPVEKTINYSIPDGVVDYDQRNSISTYEYRRLTMSSGASITVNGTLEIGSMTNPMAKGQLGPYGLIQMNAGSNITVNSGATLYAWGYIRGSGTVTVNSGAVVYENFDATDYPGSAGNMDDLNKAGVFALKEYSLNNVEVEMTVNSGATVMGFICIYGQLIKYNTFLKTFVGSNSSAMVQLTSGTIKKSYVSSRQKFFLDGTANINPINIAISYGVGDYTVNSANTSGLPFSYNWDFTISSGSLTLGDNVILLAGSTATVNTGATLVIPSGMNLYVFDADEDPSTQANDAKVTVNGTIEVSGGLYTTAAGANITSTGGGRVVYKAAAGTAEEVKLKKSSSKAGTYAITSAQLHNGEKAGYTYTETAGTTAGTTYYYCGDCDRWVTHEGKVANIVDNSQIVNHAHSLKDAVAIYDTPSAAKYIQMLANSENETVAFVDGTALDLNGCDVSGVTLSGTLYGIDSTSDGYGTPGGSITVSGSTVAAAASINDKDYVAHYDSAGGTYSFHRFAITPVACRFYLNSTTKPTHSHLAFKAALQGDDIAIGEIDDLGFVVNGTEFWYSGSLDYSKLEADEDFPAYKTVSFVAVDYEGTSNFDTVYTITAQAAFDEAKSADATISSDEMPAVSMTSALEQAKITIG